MSPHFWLNKSKTQFLAFIDYGNVKESQPKQKNSKSNKRKDSLGSAKNFNCASWSKNEDNYSATMNLLTDWKTKTYQFAYLVSFFLASFRPKN